MAYEVTATKRRPKRFEDLVGQEFVSSTLQNSISSGKIAHAYLFSGPRGCGKTSAARILAKALNCETGPTAKPCEVCTNCLEISKGSSIDVIEIDGASNTSVNDVRQIKDEILFPPQSSKYKIYIIDEVHMLSISAFNALLKTIEEPPPYVIFIFATTELHKVPATIKSRCQQFQFKLGSVEQIKDLLAKTAAEAGIQAEEEALYWIAKEATGSFRDAYTLFDQVASFSEGHISFEKIKSTLGLVGLDQLNILFENCAKGDSDKALEELDKMLQNGISVDQACVNSTEFFRSLLLIKSGITKEALLGHAAQRYSQTCIDSWKREQIEKALALFLQLYKDLRYSLNPRYELELAISRLSYLSSYTSPIEVKKALDQMREILAQTSVKARPSLRENAVENLHEINSNKGTVENPHANNSGESANENREQFANGEFENPKGFGKPQELQNTKEPEEIIEVSKKASSFSELKEKIIEELKLKHSLLAPCIMQAEWKSSNGKIIFEVKNAYTKNSIETNIGIINSLVQKYWEEETDIAVCILENTSPIKEVENHPEAVEAVCNMFKAQVISKTDAVSIEKNEYEENGDEYESF